MRLRNKRMIILLYVMDSLRPDFLSCYGYPEETSPHIDALAREGVLFTHAFAQSTWTRPSGASLLSSTYPSVHGIMTIEDELPSSIPTLPEQLRERGFLTVAISAIGNISPDFGFGRGFDHFIELYKDEALGARRKKVTVGESDYRYHFRLNLEEVPICTSEDINERLAPFLPLGRERDMFLFAWSMDTHNPYFQRDSSLARFGPPSEDIYWATDLPKMNSEGDRRRLKTLYQDMIYYNDHHLGKLIEGLKRAGVYEETLFILTADHGEAFGEHGTNSHSGIPFDEQIRVPLIVRFPQGQFRGRVNDLVQHIDLVPTVLDLIRPQDKAMPWQGKSFLPLLRDRRAINGFVFTEYQLYRRIPRYLALRTADYKYIELRPGRFRIERSLARTVSPLVRRLFKSRMLFCLRQDPEERVNLLRSHKKVAGDLEKTLQDVLRGNARLSAALTGGKRKKARANDEVARQLKALGYFE
jgi:arylsulfatase A-like enzyme